MTSAHGAWQMARNDEAEIRTQEIQAAQLGHVVVEQALAIGELQLANQFRWIVGQLQLAQRKERTPAERKRLRQAISNRTKELSEVVKEKHIQHHLAFSCIDQHDECVRKKKRQKKSPYLCFLALFICLAHSTTALLAAIARATGGHLPEIF